MDMRIMMVTNENELDGMTAPQFSQNLGWLFPGGFWKRFSCVHRSGSPMGSREQGLYEALYGEGKQKDPGGPDTPCSNARVSRAYRLEASGSPEGNACRPDIELSWAAGEGSAAFDAALLAFLYPGMPLGGELLFGTEEAVVCQYTAPEPPSGAYPGAGRHGAVFLQGRLVGTIPVPFVFAWNGCHGDAVNAGTAALQWNAVDVINHIAGRVDGRTALELLLAFEDKWGITPDDPREGGWHAVVASLLGRIAGNDELRFCFRMLRPFLLSAPEIDGGDKGQAGRREAAEKWLASDARWKRVCDSFRVLGIPKLENVCAAQGGFAGTEYEDADEWY